MKTDKKIIWIVVATVLAVVFFWGIGSYNSMVSADENVEGAWGQVQNQYQRRIDLVPNLVNVVKGYAAHEKETLENVMNARAKATQMTIDPSTATPEQLAAFQKAQGELGQALGRLIAMKENYPDLKANQNFLKLQDQLEGVENRIAVARNTFNDQAKAYNVLIRKFPKNVIASLAGFDKRNYFEAEAGAEKAPTVEF